MIYGQVEEGRKRQLKLTFIGYLLCARYHVRYFDLTLHMFYNSSVQVLSSLFYRRNSYFEKLNHSPKGPIASKTADFRFEPETTTKL